MRCLNCGTENNRQDRSSHDGKCSKCLHPFIFDPLAGGIKLTDKAFESMVARVCVDGTLKFTEAQLCYQIARKTQSNKGHLGCLSFAVGFMVVFVGLLFKQFAVVFGGIILCFLLPALAVGFSKKLTRYAPLVSHLSENELANQISKWEAANGKILQLLPPVPETNLALTQGPQAAAESAPIKRDVPDEIKEYSFDRVVVTDKNSIAQFLIANNFHFENNCAVLSIDGYPEDIFGTVMEMLRKNDQLKVFALHDARPLGLKVAHVLKTSGTWFAGQAGATVYDIGLYPRQIFDRPLFRKIGEEKITREFESLPQEIKRTLTKQECDFFFQGYYVELEAFAPQALLRLVAVEIGKTRTSTEVSNTLAGDGGVDVMPGPILISDSFG